MKVITLILAIALSVGCSNTTPPRAIVVSPPARQAQVTPVAIKVKEQVDRADRSAGDVKVNTKVAVEKAKALKDKGAATQGELTGMWELLTQQDKLVARLVDDVFQAKQTTDKLPAAAVAKDTEAELLRQGNETLTKKAELDNKYIEKASKKIENQAGDAQVGKWVRWAVIGGAILAVIALILFTLTKLGIIAAKVAS